MIRKMLLIASVIAMPLGATAITAIAGPAIAGAVPIVCHPTPVLGALFWAAPGLTFAGTFSANPTSTANTSAQTHNCTGGVVGDGGIPALSIVTNSTMCTALNAPVLGCAAGLYNYGSISGFLGNVGNLWTSLPTISWTINGVPYAMTSNSSNLAAVCPFFGEVGFTIHGVVTTGPAVWIGHVAKYVACFSTDGGPFTTGSTSADFASPPAAMSMTGSVLSSNGKIRVA